jgi:hypothetical protein
MTFVTGRTLLRTRLADPLPTALAALSFAAGTAAWLRFAWHPPAGTYLQFVPIAAVFAAFVWDRLFPRPPADVRALFCDGAVIVLALMRVLIPPFPFVSGHALLTAYAALAARRRPLRAIAYAVLAQVVYDKVFASGGWMSMVGGFAVAAILVRVSRWRGEHPASPASR